MTQWHTLADIRREYGDLSLSEINAAESPFVQFKTWFSDILQNELADPTAMVLSTVDEQGHPDSRVVLLKALDDEAFVFYTNYKSAKAIQIQHTPYVALNFYWPQMARQVRVRGRVKPVDPAQSDQYFSSRPVGSQFAAIASPQSQVIAGRSELEQAINALIATHQQEPLLRPLHWGGYAVLPNEFEFWQGRANRLHDRIQYYQQDKQWLHRRLAP